MDQIPGRRTRQRILQRRFLRLVEFRGKRGMALVNVQGFRQPVQ